MSGEAKELGERALPAALLGRVLLGRYRLQSVLGQGGWSHVFEAYDERLLRPVAVKVFMGFSATTRARDESRRNFVAEAYALSQLRHPNTLRIYDFGTLDGTKDDIPFQVTELMEGGTLAARVDRAGPLAAEHATAIITALAGAAHEAHGYGIIHRDIKPSNILFGHAGDVEVVKLADFSIAQTRDRADTNPGERPLLFCSLGWSAPEQAKSAAVDRTVDVYGLALVLGYMLHGKRLKVHTQLADFHREPAQHDRVVDEALARTRIPPAFVAVIRAATRARPEERLPSAADFIEAVEAASRETAREMARASARASVVVQVVDAPTVILDDAALEEIAVDALPVALPADDALGDDAPADSEPADSEPADSAPADSAPADSEPADSELADSEPADSELAVDETTPSEIPEPMQATEEPAPDVREPISLAEGAPLLPDGRPLSWIAVERSAIVEGSGAPRRGPRLRVTLLPSPDDRPRLHLRGLNCFLRRTAGPPTSGVDLAHDEALELLSELRRPAGHLRVTFAKTHEARALLPVGEAPLHLPATLQDAILVELLPAGDAFLLHTR